MIQDHEEGEERVRISSNLPILSHLRAEGRVLALEVDREARGDDGD